MKQYDSRPIWEQALAAIAATNVEMHKGFAELRNQIAATNARLAENTTELRQEFGGLRAEFGELRTEFGELRTEFGELRTEVAELRSDLATTNSVMNAGFEQLRVDFSSALRGVERKIDVLNHNILDLQAEQRYVDSRLEKLESSPKPS